MYHFCSYFPLSRPNSVASCHPMAIAFNFVFFNFASDIMMMNGRLQAKVYKTRRIMAYRRKNSFRQFPFCTFALTPITDLPGPTDLLARFTGNQHPAHCGIFLLHHRYLYRLQDSYYCCHEIHR